MSIQEKDYGTIIEGANGVIVMSEKTRAERETARANKVIQKSQEAETGKDWVRWGTRNLEPQALVDLVMDNWAKPELLSTTASFIAGIGLRLYREVLVDGKIVEQDVLPTPEMLAFFERVNIDKFLDQSAFSFVYFGNVFTQMQLARNGQLYSMSNMDACLVRCQKKKNGIVENFYVSENWARPSTEGDNRNTYIVPNYVAHTAGSQPLSILHERLGLPGHPYYDTPGWYGTRLWTEMSNRLPIYHSRYIENGAAPKWHIQIPQEYFKTHFPENPLEAENELKRQMDDFLSGEENAGKSLVTRFGKTFDGKPTDGWVITPLRGETGDTATTERFNQANIANLTGHGIAPSLAGIESQGKLSSGSEMRLAYNIYIALKTPKARRVILEPLRQAQKLNGWDTSIRFGIRNVMLNTLDAGQGGMKEVVI